MDKSGLALLLNWSESGSEVTEAAERIARDSGLAVAYADHAGQLQRRGAQSEAHVSIREGGELYRWICEVDRPSAPFLTMHEGKPFCQGVVFSNSPIEPPTRLFA